MPRDKDFKRHVRRRMDGTGERYTEAREHLRAGDLAIQWSLVGEGAAVYALEVVRDDEAPGRVAHVLRSIGDPAGETGGMHGTVSAEPYRGQRVRFAAMVQAVEVAGWAATWMRVDGPAGTRPTFGGTQEHALTGTTDWVALAVVLDVPPDAERIVLGAVLRGRGAVRLAVARLEVVPESVPTSGPFGPGGWILDGSRMGRYDLSAETEETPAGPALVSVLRSHSPVRAGFGSMSRTAAAEPYRGGRIRFAATLRGEAATGHAGLWMRLDGVERRVLGFDNMEHRPLRGVFEWTTVAVVLDVPEETNVIAYGVLLHGEGVLRATGARLEPVDRSVPVTGWPHVGDGWRLGGSRPDAFALTVDRVEGRRVGLLRAVADPGIGGGSVAQMVAADHYRGRGVRLRAALRAEGEGSRISLFLDVIAPASVRPGGPGRPPLMAPFTWTQHERSLEVPENASAIVIGVGVGGPGSVWITDVRLEADDLPPLELDFSDHS